MKKRPDIMHGLSRHPLYFVWVSMLRRCDDPRKARYERYGARGIKVCAEWYDITKFVAWAESAGYQEGLQIDRIDNDGDYEPSNCRFVTAKENLRRRSTTKLTVATVAEIKRILLVKECSQSEVARRFQISPVTVHNIVSGRTWSDVCPS